MEISPLVSGSLDLIRTLLPGAAADRLGYLQAYQYVNIERIRILQKTKYQVLISPGNVNRISIII